MIPFAMMFPGHGSQSIDKLINLARLFPIIKQTFYEASETLKYDLWKFIETGRIKELHSREIQPLVLTSSVAIFRLWKQLEGPTPTILVGHSLGEYSALVCSETIKFNDAVSLVELRGKMMEEIALTQKGAMLIIIGLNQKTIIELCKVQALGQIVSLASLNSPKQIVISGHKNAVMRVGWACKAAGAKIIPFPMNICSHCDLLKPMAKKFANQLEEINIMVPKIPFLNNVDIKCEQSPAKIRSALVRQLYNPVQWIQCIEYIIKKTQLTLVVEIGLGKVLMDLTKCITSALTILSIDNNNLLLAIKKIKETYHS
ncbi:MAG: ACP S-malonyltransferase [Candidatus Dasytiphilus stammeri]